MRRGYLLLFAITVVLFYFTCSYIYLLLSLFLFKCSLLENIFVSVTNKQYLVSINFHVHIRAILDKWDYVSKTLFTIFKGSL